MDSPMTLDVFQSPAVAIFCDLERDGFHVELTADGALSIAPRSRLTPARMQAIAASKDAIRQLVRSCDDGVQARRDVFEFQLAQTPAPCVPAFVFRSDVPYVPGVCFSCGDRQPALRFGRCWRCSLAWRLACRLPVPAALADALDAARVA